MVCKQQDCAIQQASVVKLCRNLLEHELWDSFGSITDRKFKSSGVESGPLQEKALFQQLGIVLNFLGTAFHSQRHLMRVDRTNWAKSPLQSKDQCVLKQSAPKSN